MKITTVAQMKRGKDSALSPYPKEGSLAWIIWTELNSSKGHAVSLHEILDNLPDKSAFGSAIRSLKDFYGLDIRLAVRRKTTYILAGEWFGSEYKDYCAEEFHKGLQNDPH